MHWGLVCTSYSAQDAEIVIGTQIPCTETLTNQQWEPVYSVVVIPYSVLTKRQVREDRMHWGIVLVIVPRIPDCNEYTHTIH